MAPEADFRRVPWALACGRHHGLGYARQMVVEASVEQCHSTRRTMRTVFSRQSPDRCHCDDAGWIISKL